MKRLFGIMVAAAFCLSGPTAQASGIIINSIKSHLENRPTVRHRAPDPTPRPAPNDARKTIPANPLEVYVQKLLEAISAK